MFDFSSSADDGEHEHSLQGVPIAFGPRPCWLLCRPSVQGFYFRGDEWAFEFYGPVCTLWRAVNGYERPQRVG